MPMHAKDLQIYYSCVIVSPSLVIRDETTVVKEWEV